MWWADRQVAPNEKTSAKAASSGAEDAGPAGSAVAMKYEAKNKAVPVSPPVPQPVDAPGPRRQSTVDFTALKPGGTIPEWSISQGSFQLVDREGKTTLELSPEPMIEGQVVWSSLMPRGGEVRIRAWGEKARRVSPRFTVGLLGTTPFWFRAVPSEKIVEIVAKEDVIASAPWEWNPEAWVWLEFRTGLEIDEQGRERTVLEGRVWHEGETKPEEPTLKRVLSGLPGLIRAGGGGAPYALKPVYIDRLEAVAY